MKKIFLLAFIAIAFSACGGGNSKKIETKNTELEEPQKEVVKRIGYYIDSAVKGLDYSCGRFSGKTDSFGRFDFEEGKGCIFSIGGLTILEKSAEALIVHPVVKEKNPNRSRFLQILDKDGNPDNNIEILPQTANALKAANITSIPSTEDEFQKVFDALQNVPTYNGKHVSQKSAEEHVNAPRVDTIIPTISLRGSSLVEINEGVSYTDAGATASDDTDGDISAKIIKTGSVNINVAGVYTIKYNITDKAGNKAVEVKRTVTVKKVDKTIPTITLKGSPSITIYKGDTYTDAGAIGSDDTDGNITAKIVKTGSVKSDIPATYMIKYNLSDKSGNKAVEVIRTVVVKEKPVQVLVVPKQDIVDRHNFYRSLVFKGSKLSWDDELARHAQEWVDYLSDNFTQSDHGSSPHAGSFQSQIHNNDEYDEGENIAWSSGTMKFVSDEPINIDIPRGIETAVDSWANEKAYYDYDSNSQKSNFTNKPIGHYTQVVWEKTRKIGCAKAKSKTTLGGEWLVCRYAEPGNMTINGIKQKPYIKIEDDFVNDTRVVNDIKRSLTWIDEETPKKNWDEANSYCQAMVANNHDDWRLPEAGELLTLPNYKARVGQDMKNTKFQHISSDYYWSATYKGADFFSKKPKYWIVELASTRVAQYEVLTNSSIKSNKKNTICVRGDIMSLQDRFTNTPTTVIDKKTNLEWQDAYYGKYMDFIRASQATSYCESIKDSNFGIEGDGWRTPSLTEIASIVNVESGKYYDAFIYRDSTEQYYTYSNDATVDMPNQNHWLVGVSDVGSSFEVYHHICPIGQDTTINIRCVRDKQ